MCLPQAIAIRISVNVAVAGDDDGEQEEDEEDPGDEKAWTHPCGRHPVPAVPLSPHLLMASLGGNLTTLHLSQGEKVLGSDIYQDFLVA